MGHNVSLAKAARAKAGRVKACILCHKYKRIRIGDLCSSCQGRGISHEDLTAPREYAAKPKANPVKRRGTQIKIHWQEERENLKLRIENHKQQLAATQARQSRLFRVSKWIDDRGPAIMLLTWLGIAVWLTR